MLNLARHHQWTIFSLLLLLLVATRGQHVASVDQLPGASWAVFFLAGIYLRWRWIPLVLMGCVLALDIAPLLLNGDGLTSVFSGDKAYCISPAYLFLLPAYGALWMCGQWYASKHCFQWKTLNPLIGAFLVGAIICELFSSGGFYLFSGHFSDPSLVEFATRVSQYFPSYLQSMFFYLSLSFLIHVLFVLFSQGRLTQIHLRTRP